MTPGVYEELPAEDAMPQAALAKMLLGVSFRDYADVVETARAGLGVMKKVFQSQLRPGNSRTGAGIHRTPPR